LTESFDLVNTDRLVADHINSDPYMEDLMRTLCEDIAPRPAGSAAIEKARVLLAENWRGFGASVHAEPVPIEACEQEEALLQMLAPDDQVFDCIACVNSGSGEVEGPLLDAGNTSFEDMSRLAGRARGAILLVRGFDFTGGKFETLQKRVSLAEAAGAAAVILVGKHPDLPAVFFLNRATVPVLNVSAIAGRVLADLCGQGGVRVRVRVAGRTRKSTCANLIGELGPDSAPDEIIAMCAHLDSFSISPGAIDDLSGIVAMTEIARVLAPYRRHFRRALRFIAFTGEEIGYAGSLHYVREHNSDLDRLRLLLSLDCLFEETARGVAVMGSPTARDYIAETLSESHPEVDVRNWFCMSSDYLPFMLQGVPTARPADWTDSFPNWTHTAEDTSDRLPVSWLRSNTLVSARLILRLLTDPEPLPMVRNSIEDVRELVRLEGAEESLRWQIALSSYED
jgi:carboxypeptidase Q